MEAINIEILNPKAKRILQSLEELNLIRINKPGKSAKGIKQLLTRLRSKQIDGLPFDEITSEVEDTRAERYAKKEK